MSVVFIVGVVQAFFIVIILLNKKKKSLSDKILAVWIFAIGVHLLLYYFHYTELYLEYPHLLGLNIPLPLIHGPLLLMYVNTLIKEDQKFNPYWLLHFIPAIGNYLFLIPELLLPADEKMRFAFEVVVVDPPLYFLIFDFLINISGPVYVIWSLILLRRHHIRIKENFSYTKNINLKWLRNLIFGMGMIWAVVLLTDQMDGETGSVMIFTAVTLFTFLVGYYGARQGIIFTDSPLSQETRFEEKKAKYNKSGFDEKQSKTYLDRLFQFIKEEKPYLESKITLPQLATQLEINPNYLSQLINENLNQNFYDFINQYRVEEFKEKLKSEDASNYTLFGHAQDCGFSSKSSFYEVFKKHTGQTPSQYQAHILGGN